MALLPKLKLIFYALGLCTRICLPGITLLTPVHQI
jgi:hypothetical protein